MNTLLIILTVIAVVIGVSFVIWSLKTSPHAKRKKLHLKIHHASGDEVFRGEDICDYLFDKEEITKREHRSLLWDMAKGGSKSEARALIKVMRERAAEKEESISGDVGTIVSSMSIMGEISDEEATFLLKSVDSPCTVKDVEFALKYCRYISKDAGFKSQLPESEHDFKMPPVKEPKQDTPKMQLVCNEETEYKIHVRKPKQKDRVFLTNKLIGIMELTDDDHVSKIISSKKQEVKDASESEKEEAVNLIATIVTETIKSGIVAFDDEIVPWIQDMLEVTPEEYAELPMNIELMFFDYMRTAPEAGGFFTQCLREAKLTSWFAGKLKPLKEWSAPILDKLKESFVSSAT